MKKPRLQQRRTFARNKVTRTKNKGGGNWKKLWRLMAGLILVIILLFLLAQIFRVKQVDVTFDNYSCEDRVEVESQLNLQGKVTLWLNEVGIEQSIKSRTLCVKDVELRTYLPDRVAVLVKGRVPVAAVIKGEGLSGLVNLAQVEATAASSAATIDFSIPQPQGEKYFMDEDGVLFYSTAGEVNLPTVYIGQDLSLRQNLGREVGTGLKELFFVTSKIGISPKLVKLTNPDNVVVINKDGEKMVLNLKNDLLKQLASLQLIWQKNKIDAKRIESIDLRFDKPVVIYSK